jgi:hypothetical protein
MMDTQLLYKYGVKTINLLIEDTPKPRMMILFDDDREIHEYFNDISDKSKLKYEINKQIENVLKKDHVMMRKKKLKTIMKNIKI